MKANSLLYVYVTENNVLWKIYEFYQSKKKENREKNLRFPLKQRKRRRHFRFMGQQHTLLGENK